jgi:ribose-phosphate pyrophosphokinase
MLDDFVILRGTANPRLATAVAESLETPLGAVAIERFPDGECSVQLLQTVRHKHVFVIQPTRTDQHLVELLCLVDAARRAAAARITAVIPYLGYSRSDKRGSRREPIAAGMIARMLQSVGVDHLVTLDLHAPQIEGFYHIPVDALTAVPTLCRAIREEEQPPAGMVVVSPDAGRVKTAMEYSRQLDAPVVVLHKRRQSDVALEITHVVGDVRGRPCLIIDDMISTGGTLARAIDALFREGATEPILIAATHGPLLDDARRKLDYPTVKRVLVTDTIGASISDWPGWRIVSVSELLATAIRCIARGESLRELF